MATKKTRARTGKGRYRGDDPSTPNKNEAWVEKPVKTASAKKKTPAVKTEPPQKKAPAKKTAKPESLLDDEEREIVEAQIKKQQEKLESGKFHVVDRDTNGGTAKAMKASNPFDDTNYNDDDIYKQ